MAAILPFVTVSTAHSGRRASIPDRVPSLESCFTLCLFGFMLSPPGIAEKCSICEKMAKKMLARHARRSKHHDKPDLQ
jgi:hypothetical protein